MPKTKAKLKPTSQPQAAKFKAMAKEVEADSDEHAFDAALKKLAQPRLQPKK